MSVNITISADGDRDDVAAYLRHVAEQVEEGFTSGHVDAGRHWEVDDYADEERERATSAWD